MAGFSGSQLVVTKYNEKLADTQGVIRNHKLMRLTMQWPKRKSLNWLKDKQCNDQQNTTQKTKY